MKHSATSFDLEVEPVTHPAIDPVPARASWPLPEPTLTYFPNARFALSDRDLGAGASHHLRGGVAVAEYGHVPVLLERCVELLTPALARGLAAVGAAPARIRRIACVTGCSQPGKIDAEKNTPPSRISGICTKLTMPPKAVTRSAT